jgi:hypothetical protein
MENVEKNINLSKALLKVIAVVWLDNWAIKRPMKIEIIYLTQKDRILSSIAKDIAANVTMNLQSLANQIEKEKAKITIHFGSGNSKIVAQASPQLQQAIAKLL